MTRPDSALVAARLAADLAKSRGETDRMFRWLLLAQWGVAVAVAAVATPAARAGSDAHMWTAFVLGGALCVTPLAVVARHPASWFTRHAIAATQVLFSALLIHVTDGRVEAHFHVFGSLAVLAFYRDWKVLATATVIVIADHLVRGWLWPVSMYGVEHPEWWRPLEHGAWVLSEGALLLLGINRSLRDLRCIAEREARLAEVHAVVERQVAERTAELAASREQFRALVETTSAISWEFLPEEQRSSYVSPSIEALLGHATARYEEPGFWRSVIHPDDLAHFERSMQRGLVEGADFQEELRLITRDGRTVHVRSVVAIVRKGGSTALRGVTFDISHQRLLEAELREAQKLESIGRLAAGVAHGINTPLQYIGNNVEFLALATSRLVAALAAVGSLGHASDPRIGEIFHSAKLGTLESRLPAAIAATQEGLHAVERIVGTLRQLTGTKRATAPAIAIAVAECLEVTIDRVRAETPEIAIELAVDPFVNHVLGDPDGLGHAIRGLVRNAVEACLESERPEPRVQVVALRRAHLVEIHVHDEGRGMSDAVRQRIFDPFFTTKGVGHGSGEGLNRIRDIIIGEHGGELSCERSSSEGTTFVVRLAAVEIPARVA